MHLRFTLYTVILLLVVGCESTQHYNRTQVVQLGPQVQAKPYGSVRLFLNPNEVRTSYEITAIMSVEGSAGDEAAFMKAFLYRAADLGADGVIFYRVSMVEGIGLLSSPLQDVVYKGEAIRFR